MTAMAHPDRLRTLNTVSTPHGAAMSAALKSDEDQRRRSAYFEVFRSPDGERQLLDGWLRELYAGLPAERIDRYVERHVQGPYRFEIVPGVSHWISEEAPERLSALLLAHLAAW
jgi:pimeloyl-ACP methyl ester carboxylesterase